VWNIEDNGDKTRSKPERYGFYYSRRGSGGRDEGMNSSVRVGWENCEDIMDPLVTTWVGGNIGLLPPYS